MNHRLLALSGTLALLVAAPGAMAAQIKPEAEVMNTVEAEDILDRIHRSRYVLSGTFERKRDIFTFRKPLPKLPPIGGERRPQPPRPGLGEKPKGNDRDTPPPKPVYEYESIARSNLDDAVGKLAHDQFNESASAARNGLDVLQRSGDKIEDEVRFELHEKLDRIRVAAERQMRRLAIEKRFHGLALHVNGILHSETGPRAVVGANVVGEGDILDGARIRRIERNHVVFEYEGLLIRRSLPRPQVKGR